MHASIYIPFSIWIVTALVTLCVGAWPRRGAHQTRKKLRERLPIDPMTEAFLAFKLHKNPESIYEAADTPDIRRLKAEYVAEIKKQKSINNKCAGIFISGFAIGFIVLIIECVLMRKQ
jgi:hypothetical protein